LMKLLFQRGQARDRQTAEDLLVELEQRMPNDPELMGFRAIQLLAVHQENPQPETLAAAKAKLEEVIKVEPTAVNAHLALIGIAVQSGEYERARECVIRAIGSNPDNTALLSAHAEIELALNNSQMAIKIAQMVVREDPNDAVGKEVLLAVARNTRDEELLRQARQLLEADLAANPGDEQLLLSRAQILVLLGQPKAAIPELEVYCQADPGRSSTDALVTLADLHRIAGNMEKAGQRLQQAEKLDGTNQNVIHARLMWLVAQRRFDEVGGVVTAYLTAPEQKAATVVKAATLLAATDSIPMKNQAVKLFEHALTLSPKLLSARLGLAATRYQIGDAEGAKKLYQDLLAEFPKHVQVLNDLAWVLQESEQRYAEALELASRGLALKPSNLNLLDTRGTILKHMPGRLRDAKQDFKALVKWSPEESTRRAKAMLQLGRVCTELNELPEAKEHLRAALEIDQKTGVLTDEERSEISAMF